MLAILLKKKAHSKENKCDTVSSLSKQPGHKKPIKLDSNPLYIKLSLAGILFCITLQAKLQTFKGIRYLPRLSFFFFFFEHLVVIFN